MSRVLPILFNTDMVRAILDGRKTVTRRIIKSQQLIGLLPDKCKNGTPEEFLKEKKLMFKPYCDMTDAELIKTAYNPPYQPGDILYVRETWSPVFVVPRRYLYKVGCEEAENLPIKWHPSIHMPKEAARIWLKVTDVRVEQLKECGNGWCLGIEKEGVVTPQSPILYINDDRYHDALREEFQKLWDSTIKKSDIDRYGWDANPLVWVIEFERCEKPEDI